MYHVLQGIEELCQVGLSVKYLRSHSGSIFYNAERKGIDVNTAVFVNQVDSIVKRVVEEVEIWRVNSLRVKQWYQKTEVMKNWAEPVERTECVRLGTNEVAQPVGVVQPSN